MGAVFAEGDQAQPFHDQDEHHRTNGQVQEERVEFTEKADPFADGAGGALIGHANFPQGGHNGHSDHGDEAENEDRKEEFFLN